MATVNTRRVWLGALLGGLVWNIWTVLIEAFVIGRERYDASGYFLPDARYPYFIVVWALALFAGAFVLAWVYANVRATQGPGPRTAAKVGIGVGFAAGFPLNFANAAWLPMERVFPLWWTIELWGGAILAALVAGWIYREGA